MDPEISSCPDSPDRDPSLEFCNDWEEPRDLLLKAGFFHPESSKKGSKIFWCLRRKFRESAEF